jgi:hypothetical protein
MSKHGAQAGTDMVLALVIDAIITKELAAALIIQKEWKLPKAASIQFVLEAYIDVAAEIVLPVLDVLVT